METDVLRFKRGETVEISLIFEVLDDLGIASLTGVVAAAKLRRRYSAPSVARFETALYPEIGLLVLTIPSETCRLLAAGQYVFDVQFRRLSDGLTQSTGDIALEILEGTSHVGQI